MKRTALIEARKQSGMTQEELSNASGVGRSYYSLIETGIRNPTLGIALKIATALDKNIGELFPDEIFFANKCYDTKL